MQAGEAAGEKLGVGLQHEVRGGVPAEIVRRPFSSGRKRRCVRMRCASARTARARRRARVSSGSSTLFQHRFAGLGAPDQAVEQVEPAGVAGLDRLGREGDKARGTPKLPRSAAAGWCGWPGRSASALLGGYVGQCQFPGGGAPAVPVGFVVQTDAAHGYREQHRRTDSKLAIRGRAVDSEPIALGRVGRSATELSPLPLARGFWLLPEHRARAPRLSRLLPGALEASALVIVWIGTKAQRGAAAYATPSVIASRIRSLVRVTPSLALIWLQALAIVL